MNKIKNKNKIKMNQNVKKQRVFSQHRFEFVPKSNLWLDVDIIYLRLCIFFIYFIKAQQAHVAWNDMWYMLLLNKSCVSSFCSLAILFSFPLYFCVVSLNDSEFVRYILQIFANVYNLFIFLLNLIVCLFLWHKNVSEKMRFFFSCWKCHERLWNWLGDWLLRLRITYFD